MRSLSYVSSAIPANIIMSEQMSDKCKKINDGDMAAGDTPTTNLRIALLQILHRLQEALLAKVTSDPNRITIPIQLKAFSFCPEGKSKIYGPFLG